MAVQVPVRWGGVATLVSALVSALVCAAVAVVPAGGAVGAVAGADVSGAAVGGAAVVGGVGRESGAAVDLSAPARVRVSVYGDSRARSLGRGLKRLPGWLVDVQARNGCAFLGQDQIWRQYGTLQRPSERSSAGRPGRVARCDTRTYVGSRPYVDVAVVFAGTLLMVNNGVDAQVRSPLEPEWAAYLEQNVFESISRIDAGRVVVLDTPPSVSGVRSGAMGDVFWDDRDRIDAVDAILAAAAARAGALFVDGFAAWVMDQGRLCAPDGSHMTGACAARAGVWLRDRLVGLGVLDGPLWGSLPGRVLAASTAFNLAS